MKYDLMADANDTTFSRTNDGGNVIYKLAGIKDFQLEDMWQIVMINCLNN